jgi:hypothetical protein
MGSGVTHRLAGVAVTVAMVTSACGGDASTDGVATLSEAVTTTGPTADIDVPTNEEALLAFTACLRENGVDIDDPTVDVDGNVRLNAPARQGGREGPDGNEDFRQARQACADLLSDVALGSGRDADRTELEDDLVTFAGCMRDNGYDMPDPDFSSFGPGSGGGGPFGEIDQDDPAFQAASDACADILAGFGPGPGGGRRGGGGGSG